MSNRIFLVLGVLVSLTLGCQKSGHDGTQNGDVVGNGGDGVVLEFRALAGEGVAIAKANSQDWPDFDFARLQTLNEKAQVLSTDQTLMEGNQVRDAVNQPDENKIYVNRGRWSQINPDNRRALAFHELLGLMKVPDVNYALSSQILGFDPLTFAARKKGVDILLVVDNSGSMADHQKNLSSRINYVLNAIAQQNIDYHIGVTSTDDADKGALLGAVPYVTPKTPNGYAIIAQSVLLGIMGSTIETALDSVANAVSAQMICLGCPNEGFLRQAANLEIITISDAEDSGSLVPADLVKNLITLKSGKASHVSVTSFMPIPGDATCPSEYGATAPARLIGFNTLLNGDIRNLCAPDLTLEYTRTGEQIALRVQNAK